MCTLKLKTKTHEKKGGAHTETHTQKPNQTRCQCAGKTTTSNAINVDGLMLTQKEQTLEKIRHKIVNCKHILLDFVCAPRIFFVFPLLWIEIFCVRLLRKAVRFQFISQRNLLRFNAAHAVSICVCVSANLTIDWSLSFLTLSAPRSKSLFSAFPCSQLDCTPQPLTLHPNVIYLHYSDLSRAHSLVCAVSVVFFFVARNIYLFRSLSHVYLFYFFA